MKKPWWVRLAGWLFWLGLAWIAMVVVGGAGHVPGAVLLLMGFWLYVTFDLGCLVVWMVGSLVAWAVRKQGQQQSVHHGQGQGTLRASPGRPIQPESTGSKVVRCLFAYCAGIEGTSTASVTLSDSLTNEVLYSYEVRKAGAHNYQSRAEAIAKHLKHWLEGTGK